MSAAELPRPPASADHRLDDPETLWQRCCARLAMEMPEQQFNTWIRPLPAAEVARDGQSTLVSVRVPNRFMLDWVRTQYSARIEALLGEEQTGAVRIEFGLAPRAAAPVPNEVCKRLEKAGFSARPELDGVLAQRR